MINRASSTSLSERGFNPTLPTLLTMKKCCLLALFTVLGSFASLQAQEASKFLTVNLVEVFENYKKVQDAKSLLEDALRTAQEQVDVMVQEGQALVAELEDLRARINNPALTEEAKQAAAAEAAAKEAEIRTKQAAITEYEQETRRTLAERERSIISVHIDEIKDIVSQLAAERSALIVFNSSNNDVIYSQEAQDITKDVIERINRAAESNT